MLRGPQTLGEIKDRSERIFAFADLEETKRVLEKLAEWPVGPLARKLRRQPGQKEQRYAQLLTGEPAIEEMDAAAQAGVTPSGGRLSSLEAEVDELKTEVSDLRRRLEDLENQFR